MSDSMQQQAARAGAEWKAGAAPPGETEWQQRFRANAKDLQELMDRAAKLSVGVMPGSTAPTQLDENEQDARMWVKENGRLVRAAIVEAQGALANIQTLDFVAKVPRVVKLGALYCEATSDTWHRAKLEQFVAAFQRHQALKLRETWALPVGIKMGLLARLAAPVRRLLDGNASTEEAAQVPRIMKSLLAMSVVVWAPAVEPLVAFEPILRHDPVYPRMDDATRDRYRNIVAHLARRSDCSEVQVAQVAVDLARRQPALTPGTDLRKQSRHSHVGYYLMDRGRRHLERAIGYHATGGERISRFLHAHAADFYISGAQLLLLLLTAVLMVRLVSYSGALFGVALAFLFLIIPASQGAVEIMNHIVSAIFPAEALPKLDFSRGVPAEAATLVAVPALLISEKQTRRLVEDLEVRYLANIDKHLHFCLLTDLPDSTEPPEERDSHPLVQLAVRLIEEANVRNHADGGGGFLLLHRHRVYNAREGAWIGWERKRGKLLDLNQLLSGAHDAFPIKAGRLECLPSIRYVLTLDADTQLPREAARRLVGTIEHPLNHAVIDPEKRIVVEGYGILQPRIGISIQSASRSRLASLFSGETGLDIYSRAVSDVYQDLFGEAIFTGKGLYDVEALQQVLQGRFPRNALLSHDLIEGSYARAGLVSDIELIDDYPSHLSAWSRRKHRWVRGDWQISQWLFAHVPDEKRRQVPNPISPISRWKIFDNLRRSLVEPAMLLLFIAGWFGLPGGPLYWTSAVLLLIFLPVFVQLFASLLRAALNPVPGAVVDAMEGFYKAIATQALAVALLPAQAFLSIDAVVRTLVRRFVTGRRLLEWETAAQAEVGAKSGTRNPVDLYLKLLPLFSLVTGVLLAFLQPYALPFAVPVLLVWGAARPLTGWLNRAPGEPEQRISATQRDMLRELTLRTWRYFADFSTAEHNWLIPDNVEETNWKVAARVSPTNIGLLLNARQVALEFGYLTLPEFAALSANTTRTLTRMERHHGHLLNWYETDTLNALTPRIISSVDNGNLMASLWTLRHHCLELRRTPLFRDPMHAGLLDHFRLYLKEDTPGQGLAPLASRGGDESGRINSLVTFAVMQTPEFMQQLHPAIAARLHAIAEMTRGHAPWLLPEFAALRNALEPAPQLPLTPAAGDAYIDQLEAKLHTAPARFESSPELNIQAEKLRQLLPAARGRLAELNDSLAEIAAACERLACDMDFSLLHNPARGLLSIAYNVDEQRLEDACYDLLASEARTATFLAIAKGDIPQSTWFRLGRVHTFAGETPLLISWTGTMFEYLMPGLWMRSFRGSMLARTELAVVAAQQSHVARLRIPWGISESACDARDVAGHYQYHAFGLAEIASSANATDGGPVIAPYASCLALQHDPAAANRNIERMIASGWLSDYGLYEAADYAPGTEDRAHMPPPSAARLPQPGIVRSWMAHHHGMSLLALCNTLANGAVQRWFHADRRVQATELLLHERPMRAASLAAVRATMPRRPRTPA